MHVVQEIFSTVLCNQRTVQKNLAILNRTSSTLGNFPVSFRASHATPGSDYFIRAFMRVLTIIRRWFACAMPVTVISHNFRLLPSSLVATIAAPWFSARQIFFDGARRRAHLLAGLPADPECRGCWWRRCALQSRARSKLAKNSSWRLNKKGYCITQAVFWSRGFLKA